MSLPLDGCNLVVRLDAIEKSIGWKKFVIKMERYGRINACSDGYIFKTSSNNPGMDWIGLIEMLRKIGLRKRRDYIIGDFFDNKVPCSWAEIFTTEGEGRIKMKGVDAPDVPRGALIEYKRRGDQD